MGLGELLRCGPTEVDGCGPTVVDGCGPTEVDGDAGLWAWDNY